MRGGYGVVVDNSRPALGADELCVPFDGDDLVMKCIELFRGPGAQELRLLSAYSAYPPAQARLSRHRSAAMSEFVPQIVAASMVPHS